MADRYQVTMFGTFRIALDGAAVDVRAGLSRAILGRLALSAGASIPAEQLVADLWQSPPANALGSLRVYISRLRSGPLAAVLQGGRGGYCLDIAADDVDVLRFRRLAEEAIDSGDNAPESVFTAPLSLWTAAPFEDLTAFPFTGTPRQEWRGLRRVLLERWSHTLIERGETAKAIAALEPAVSEEPLQHSLVAMLARAYSSGGRTSEALAVIDRLRELLAEREGLDPSPTLLSLRQAILRQDASVVAPRADSAVQRHNIPVPLTGLVGRQEELRRIEDARAANRLVTLVGPGGAGKTRLAVESARRSTKSIDTEQWMVDLSAVSEGGDVLAATADALGAPGHSLASIAARLEGRSTLIILDNAEHVIRATRVLATDLLSSCSGLALLVTSREPLSVAGEYVIRVTGLVGDAADEAVQLFRERSTAARGGRAPARGDDATIRRMCRMLDGLPLALELAAGRTDVLSIGELSTALERGEQIPGGALEEQRHASLENTIRWSTDALDSDELTLLIELSGFAGPFTLDAVEKICTVTDRPLRDLALSLARKSLVAVDETEDGQRRYRLLESMKAFVRPMLEPSRRAAWELRHRTYFAALVDELAPAVHTHAATAAHTLLDTLAPDLQLATERAITAGDRDMALRLASGQAWHWFKRGWLAEGRSLIDRALSISTVSDPAIEARALVGGVNLAYQSGDAHAAFEYVRLGIQRATEGGDRQSLARLLAYAAYGRSLFGELEESERIMAEAMSHAEDAPEWLRSELYMSQGQTLRALGKRSLALDSLAEAQALARRAGNAWALTSSEYVAGKILIEVKRPTEAVRLLARGATSAASAGDYPGALALLHLLGGAAALLEEHALGATIFGAVDAIGRRYSYNPVDAEGADARVHRDRVAGGLIPRDFDAAYERGTHLSLAELLTLGGGIARSPRS